jgi:hypothetical protein
MQAVATDQSPPWINMSKSRRKKNILKTNISVQYENYTVVYSTLLRGYSQNLVKLVLRIRQIFSDPDLAVHKYKYINVSNFLHHEIFVQYVCQ